MSADGTTFSFDFHELVADSFAGNSVCPPVAAALVAANFQHERQRVRAGRKAA